MSCENHSGRINVVKSNICPWDVVEYKYKLAEHVNTRVNKHREFVVK